MEERENDEKKTRRLSKKITSEEHHLSRFAELAWRNGPLSNVFDQLLLIGDNYLQLEFPTSRLC